MERGVCGWVTADGRVPFVAAAGRTLEPSLSAKRHRLEELLAGDYLPQRHRAGSPLSQHTAMRSTAIARVLPGNGMRRLAGGKMKNAATKPEAAIPWATHPCHTRGAPQPQPWVFALN